MSPYNCSPNNAMMNFNESYRVERLGNEYSETMLWLYFEDFEEYNRLKTEMQNNGIERLINPGNEFNNRYISANNVNVEIKMLNCLNANDIKSYEKLISKLEKSKQQADTYYRELSRLDAQISEKRDIIKAIHVLAV